LEKKLRKKNFTGGWYDKEESKSKVQMTKEKGNLHGQHSINAQQVQPTPDNRFKA